MRPFVVFALLTAWLSFDGLAQNWSVQEVGQLPEPVSNNAVCEGFDGNTSYIYSFGGIDSTLHSSGIHLKSWRLNAQTFQVDPLPDLPDTLGKIACGASRIGNIIYIFGGYHVCPNGDELSSDKVHRFDIEQNQFISDGTPIPVPIDDHVQAVYKDSLVYLVTGWSNTGNVNAVQVYNTYTDSWQVGTETPNNNRYRCFGASGDIIGDSLYYFGGAAGFNFAAQTELRVGYINPQDPTDISWSFREPDASLTGYRAGACISAGAVHWVGGSNVTYNYNASAYNGSGLVEPADQAAFNHPSFSGWGSESITGLPMDLRGVANVTDSRKILVGGIGYGGIVSNSILQLDYQGGLEVNETFSSSKWQVYPNPNNGTLFSSIDGKLSIVNSLGKVCFESAVRINQPIHIKSLQSGVYSVTLESQTSVMTSKFVLFK